MQSGEWSGKVSTINGGFAGIRSKQLDPLIDASSCRLGLGLIFT
jgi:hypothetical protein